MDRPRACAASADDWESVLKPVVVRYKERKVQLYFRGDAAFASPKVYEYLEAEGFLYAIRLHRWAAAGPFAAMTAAHPVASRSPDRTGVCGAVRSAPSQCEMVTGPGFSSPNQPEQERTTAYRESSGPASRSDAHCAAIVGDWEEPSGESRLTSLSDFRGVAHRLGFLTLRTGFSCQSLAIIF